MRQVEGGGIVGFGCGFLFVGMVALAGSIAYVPLTMTGWAIVVAVAIVGGLLAARYGDEFFTRVGDWRWWWW